MDHANIWGKRTSYRGNCKCESPEMGVCLVCGKRTRKPDPGQLREGAEEQEIQSEGEWALGQTGFAGHSKD